jgi:hypothetical protein
MYVNGQAVAPTNSIKDGWDLLADLKPEAESRSLALPFSEVALADYDYFLIVGNVEMANADWLYLSANSSSAQEGRYFSNTSNDAKYTDIDFNENDYPFLMLQKISGSTYVAFLEAINTNAKYRLFTYDLSNNLYLVCYGKSNYITTASNIKIYGKKNIFEE